VVDSDELMDGGMGEESMVVGNLQAGAFQGHDHVDLTKVHLFVRSFQLYENKLDFHYSDQCYSHGWLSVPLEMKTF
jgi:hypothetical protein